MDVKDLKEQLNATEAEFEQAKAHVHRCEGVIQLLKHFIAEEEKPKEEATPLLDAEVV